MGTLKLLTKLLTTFLLFYSGLIGSSAANATEKLNAPQLIALATSNGPGLAEAIEASLDAKALTEGKAWAGRGPDFFFATEAASEPELFLDDAAGPKMKSVEGSKLVVRDRADRNARERHIHFITWWMGKNLAGVWTCRRLPLTRIRHRECLRGRCRTRLTHTSKIYDGMKSEYWIYVPAQYDAKTAAALMVFQDGGAYIERDNGTMVLNVIDNLIAQKKIPVMICVFINPGDISGSPGTPTYNFVKAYGEKWKRDLKDSMRSTLYDTVSDRYDEISAR